MSKIQFYRVFLDSIYQTVENTNVFLYTVLSQLFGQQLIYLEKSIFLIVLPIFLLENINFL